MPDFYSVRATKLVQQQYDENRDEVQLLMQSEDGVSQFGFLFPRTIAPLVCTAIATAAAKAPEHKRFSATEFQALQFKSVGITAGPDGAPVIVFEATDGAQLLMTASGRTAADLRILANALDDMIGGRVN